MNWIQILVGAIFCGISAAVVPSEKIIRRLGIKMIAHKLIFALAILVISVVLGHLLRRFIFQISGNVLLADIGRAIMIGIGLGFFPCKELYQKTQDEESYIGESNTKDVDTAGKIYNHIVKGNPYVSPLAPTASAEDNPEQTSAKETAEEVGLYNFANKKYIGTRAPGRMFLLVTGALYILVGIIGIVGWLTGTLPPPFLTGFGFFMGTYGILKCDDISSAGILRTFAIINLFLTVLFVRHSISLAMGIALAHPILFLVGAQKNYAANKKM